MDKRLIHLRKLGAFIGTSSWKYPGWRGLVYRAPYPSEKNFQANALKEYAALYPTVGVDHTYYNFPSQQQLDLYNEQTPPHFRFVFKAPDQITALRFPHLSRYGKRAGQANPHFLDPELFKEKLLIPLTTLGPKAGPIVFEFSRFKRGAIENGRAFLARLEHFFKVVRAFSDHPIAIEIRNRNWLAPEYFQLLCRHQVAHVFNSWTYMPSLEEQQAQAKGVNLPFYVSRLLLCPGTLYADAVRSFSPYREIKNPMETVRIQAAALLERALHENKPIYLLINNRLEGCAPLTLQAILDLIPELAE